MNRLDETHFKRVEKCPWCGGNEKRILYKNQYDACIQECNHCKLVYSDKILNEQGLEIYWNSYLSQVQNKDTLLTQKRMEMYDIEFQFISRLIDLKDKEVLDIGCGSGAFLGFFEDAGANCYGVEYGDEASKEAEKRFKIWKGEFPKIEIEGKFDLIIFRGSLQYCINPKQYLKKAMELLNKDGILFITSSPNAQSLCFKLFKENFTLPVSVTDYYGFSEPLITDYIKMLGGRLLCYHYFYEETPYADMEEDIMAVAKAIEYFRKNLKIDFKAPAFYDNMLTLVYQKS